MFPKPYGSAVEIGRAGPTCMHVSCPYALLLLFYTI